MKKIAAIIFMFVLLVTSFSCKECTTCYINKPASVDTEPEEFCGKESEVEEFEEDYELRASLSSEIGARAVCSRN